MKKIGITILLLCLTWIVNGEEAKSIRVLCYNIHFGQGNDGVYDVERLAKVIYERMASDHLPVFSVIELKAE